jgi:hypothetical protein
VLQAPWRRGKAGDWLDANQTANGSVAYATSAVLSALGLYQVNVTALVSRWLGNGLNRGFYIRSRANAYPLRFAGRTYAVPTSRPRLVVTSSLGTFTLLARCNATWNTSTATAISGSADWTIMEGTQPAILQFDLGGVSGTVISAQLEVTLVQQERNSAIFEVFEADPPTMILPEGVPAPIRGIYAEHGNFAAIASHPDVLFSDDFASGGWADSGFTPAAERALNPASNTTYARGTIAAGAFVSADINKGVSRGTGPNGSPDVVHAEMFGQYWLYLEPDFGTTVDTAIKLPAMGVQFGYWNPAGGGYWQSTTGNGGSRGTGLRVTRSDGTSEYQGHSIRILSGVRPSDNSAYDGYFAVGFYPYNLDQGGPFPPGENWPYVVLRTGQWYCIDLRVKQNSMSGAQDALGNYATANPDGALEAWVNGYPVYSRTNFRWRRHADFGVQGLWIDVYHGGTIPSPSVMHYRLDRVTLAKRYIGPPG